MKQVTLSAHFVCDTQNELQSIADAFMEDFGFRGLVAEHLIRILVNGDKDILKGAQDILDTLADGAFLSLNLRQAPKSKPRRVSLEITTPINTSHHGKMVIVYNGPGTGCALYEHHIFDVTCSCQFETGRMSELTSLLKKFQVNAMSKYLFRLESSTTETEYLEF